MLASFLLSLREGLEAALIIGIVLGVLVKLKRTEMNGVVWRGVGLAALLSLVVALALNLLGMEFEGKGEEIFEQHYFMAPAVNPRMMKRWKASASKTGGKLASTPAAAIRKYSRPSLVLNSPISTGSVFASTLVKMNA